MGRSIAHTPRNGHAGAHAVEQLVDFGAIEATPTNSVVPLRYVARAGLLPELTRQTYDSLYKAIREVILNSVDAGASSVVIDVSRVGTDRVAEVRDDGSGMTMTDLQESFMSLGGSQKFGQQDKFGRIGIGSLALMHYAKSVEVETKIAGDTSVTRAELSHPWTLSQTQRSESLSDFVAGRAWREPAFGKVSDHYTLVRLIDVDDLFVTECTDVTAFYRLVDRLRRVLPLPWPATELTRQLEASAPEVVGVIRKHAAQLSADVTIRSQWANEDRLTKRVYGDGGSQEEEWNGRPHPVLHDVLVADDDSRRVVQVAGYLLSQVRQTPGWIGLTARVQNVAVEEQTFFDLESDPGFRKYITGELWVLGNVDRARLINIDRASFNRETPDYQAIARVIQHEILKFKSTYVQAPQRAKAAVKRRLDHQMALVETAERLAAAAEPLIEEIAMHGLPASRNGRIHVRQSRELVSDLEALGALVPGTSSNLPKHPFRLSIADDGSRVLAEVRHDLSSPRVTFGGVSYGLHLVEGADADPPVLIRSRPREIVFNLAHEAFGGELRPAAVEMVLSLELGYVLGVTKDDEGLYDRVLSLLSKIS